MDRSLGMENERVGRSPLQRGRMILRRMTDLERHIRTLHRNGEPMECMDWELLLIRRLRVVTMRHIENIAGNILLYHEPRTSAKAHALALAYGMEPQTFMLSYPLARFKLDDIARLFAEVTADIIIIIDLTKETDALRVPALGIDKMLAFGNDAHLVLHIMTYREEGLAQLPVVDLSQEVGLILHWIRTGAKPLVALSIDLGLGIMTCGNEIIIAPPFLVERTEG